MTFGFLSPKDFKIIWLSNVLALSVPDDCYSRKASNALTLISKFFFFTIVMTALLNYKYDRFVFTVICFVEGSRFIYSIFFISLHILVSITISISDDVRFFS